MKKTKKLLLAFCAAAICLTGCNNGMQEEEKPAASSESKISLSDKSSSELIKINIKDVTGFGTIWGANAAKTKATARAAAAMSDVGLTGGSNTLVSFDKDGKADYALTKPEGLADWCEYQPVREIYQCPSKNAEKGARGIYVVFSSYIDFWEDEAGNKLDPIGQLMYVKPDGTVIDIFGNAGKATKVILDTRIKENDDWDYIKFDNAGNLYMLVLDEDVSKVCRFNPISNELSYYTVPGTKQYPLNFEVTKDGSYILLNTLINYEGPRTITVNGPKNVGTAQDVIETGENYVYAIPVNSNGIATPLYTPIAKNYGREISNICYDSKNNTVYFGVYAGYASYQGSGLHIWKQNSSGEFTNERIFVCPEHYNWELKEAMDVDFKPAYEVCKELIKENKTTEAAEYFLDFLKSFYGKNKDKVYFTLDFFKNYKDAESWDDSQKTEIPAFDIDDVENTTKYKLEQTYDPYEELYLKAQLDSEGKVRSEIELMEYLLTTEASEQKKNNGYLNEQKIGPSMWDRDIGTLFWGWIDGFNVTYNTTGQRVAAPNNDTTALWLLFTTNPDRTWTAETAAYTGSYNLNDATERAEAKKFCTSSYRRTDIATLVSNDNGIYALFDDVEDWNATGWQKDFTKVIKLFNGNGALNMETPDSLKSVQVYAQLHKWTSDDIRNRIDSDPWYKAPFKAFNDGLVLKDRANDSIWYYDCATDSCSKIFSKPGLNIYSYALNNGVLTVNGYTDLGGNRTIKVKMSDGSNTSIDTLAKFETLIDVDIPAEE